MSEQNKAPATPTFEDVLREKLTGKTLENALDYVAYLEEIGVPGDGGVYYVPGAYLCNIHQVDETGWHISVEHIDSPLCRVEYQGFPVDEKVKEFAWAHMTKCGNHGCGYNPGRRVTLFGKEFKNTCFALLDFSNPDGEDLELLKKLSLVWKRVVDDAAGKGTLYYGTVKNEWSPARVTDALPGLPLGKAYTKTLDVEFRVTIKKTFVNQVAVGFSGGGIVPAGLGQFPAALGIGAAHLDRFEAIKGAEGFTSVEALKYQRDVTYLAEMSLNITANTYDATVWMLDADGRPDTPYYIARDYPFRLEEGAGPLTAIDRVHPLYMYDDRAYIVGDFTVVGGE